MKKTLSISNDESIALSNILARDPKNRVTGSEMSTRMLSMHKHSIQWHVQIIGRPTAYSPAEQVFSWEWRPMAAAFSTVRFTAIKCLQESPYTNLCTTCWCCCNYFIRNSLAALLLCWKLYLQKLENSLSTLISLNSMYMTSPKRYKKCMLRPHANIINDSKNVYV